MKKVVLLMGGESLEHHVSLESSKSILENIDRKKFQVLPVIISKDGTWYEYHGEISNLLNWEEGPISVMDNIPKILKSYDIVLPMIHGTFGEDGRLQSFLELFHIPYVGCNSKTSMLGMDKEYMKMVAKEPNIPMLPYQVLTKENLKNVTDFPVIVKPASGGSSIGIGVAHSRKELMHKYKEALSCDSKVIMEKYASVRELEVGILTNKKKTYFSSIGEILTDGNVYDYDKKYVDSMSTTTNAVIPKEVEKKVYELAQKISEIFSLKGMTRIDFFYEEDTNTIYFNEINTIPGFTTISMYPKLWESKKINYQKLLTNLIEWS